MLAARPAAAAEAGGFEGERMSLPASAGSVFSDARASGGRALVIWSNGRASARYATAGARAISVRARGDRCAGAPQMAVAIDGIPILSRLVTSSGWAEYGANLALPAGPHTVTISFTNDFVGGRCDRNLRLDRVRFSPAPAFEAETMALPAAAGKAFLDAGASGGRALLIWSVGYASATYSTADVRSLSVRARGDQCEGAPRMVVAIDGAVQLAVEVAATSWQVYSRDVALRNGTHTVTVSFTNHHVGGGCDRNLRVDSIVLSPTASRPLAAASWYVDPDSNAKRQADAWRATRPADAAALDKIAGEPQADWFGDWSGDVRRAVDARVSTITAAAAVPVLVAYNVPLRDCGSYSGGGASSPEAYRAWIRSFAAGIGGRPAVVILEPDALAGLDCLSPTDQQLRLLLLRDAVSVLASHRGVYVYLDAGHSGWQSAKVMAARLEQAGVALAQGFALNVSNFRTTLDETRYGTAMSALTGGTHFVVDTSRNGLGPAPDGQWCNPSGRALGDRPTAATGVPAADAYFWIKRPGESDGACGGGPGAGSWWGDYALGLAQRAAY